MFFVSKSATADRFSGERALRQWRKSFLLLSSLAGIAVFTGIGLSVYLLKLHTHAVEVNREWAERSVAYRRIGPLARGPDLAVSQAIDSASPVTLQNWKRSVAALEQEIDLLAEDAKVNLTDPHRERFLQELRGVREAAQQRIEKQGKILALTNAGSREEAARLQAELISNTTLNTAISSLFSTIDRVQNSLFLDQAEAAKPVETFDTKIAAVLILLLIMTVVWSYRSSRFLQAAIRQREKTLGKLESARKDLERNERYFRALLENNQDAIILLDAQANITYFTPSAPAHVGMSAEEFRRHNALDLIHEDDRERIEKVFSDLAAHSGIVMNAEYRMRHRTKGFVWRHTVATNLLDDPAVGAIVINARDISERVAAEELTRNLNQELEERVRTATVELKETNRQLEVQVAERQRAEEEAKIARRAAEGASQAKSQFVANMSHEIRTPLNGILGLTDLILQTNLTPHQSNYVEMLKTSGESLLVVINDVLDFAKIEAGKLAMESIPFALREKLAKPLKAMGVRSSAKGLELAVRIAPDVPEHLIGDPDRLHQVLLNLVSNAIKFTERGEILVDIQNGGSTEGSIVLDIRVSDTGIGISPERQKQIFDPFLQADLSTTRLYGGTGLGLTISSQIVRQMGGEIELESAEGKGSTFRFQARFGVQRNPVPTVTPIDPEGIRDLPVLVVDDNATNRLILAEMLTAWGMRPIVVESGRAAIEAVEAADIETGFSLILVDANMPEMDGFSLAEHLRQGPVSGAIMMLSSAMETGDMTRCEQIGIASYLVKPVVQSDLFDAILVALGKSGAVPSRTPASEIRDERSLHILVAEDNPVNQTVVRGIFEGAGHRIQVVSNGREAVEATAAEDFDLIVMDVQMPEMDGVEATRNIRKREAGSGKSTPIVALTASVLKGDRERFVAAGMNNYLSKPVSRAKLLEMARELTTESSRDTPPVDAEQAKDDFPSREKILDYIGGDSDLLNQLVHIFCKDTPLLLDKLHVAIETGEGEDVKRLAHSLKGSLSMLGAGRPSGLAAKIEELAEASDLNSAAKLLPALEEAVAITTEQVVTWRTD